LWRCERCGRTFANRNQTHRCRPLGTVDAHFAGKDPAVRETFERIGHVVLAERLERPRFTKVEVYSPRNILHAFRLREAAEVDDEVVTWLTKAYAVGRQEHLR
jgi:transposase-like protein